MKKIRQMNHLNLNIMTHKQQIFDATTFGKTPAGLYLVRFLNENNPRAGKACSVRAQTFNMNVNQIEQAVRTGMTPRVAANLLRLLRDEATTIDFDDTIIKDGKFIAQLLRNVIIGNIKRALRVVSTLRKIENGNTNPAQLSRKAAVHTIPGINATYYTILGYPAGVIHDDGDFYRQIPDYDQIFDETTPELLMERSDRRCLRQGKPHMINTEK
jgi:hypothetical protein